MTALIARLNSGVRDLRLDRAWLAVAMIVFGLAVFDPASFWPSMQFAARALVSTAPYIAFAVILIGALKASGAESLVARAFEGREARMIGLAALFGGLAPFCSCEVIPFIAGLLAVGAPLSAIMAFWLSSPLIDPGSLLITAGALGWEFAVSKAVFAVLLGLGGGFAIKAAVSFGWFADPIKALPARACGCGASPLTGKAVWRFWTEAERRSVFADQALHNAFFLLKWLTLAYLIESLMIRYVPAELIASVVGGTGLVPIVVSAAVGAPAYLNAMAAPPLVSGLMQQGMTAGAAMAFMVAGSVSSIPAMAAVFALVKRPVFAAYVALGLVGAVLSGLAYAVVVAG